MSGKRLDEPDVLGLLRRCNAILTDDHFVYTNGGHGSTYVNKDALYPHTEMVSDICKEIARKIVGRHIDVVVSPAVGGIALSQWTAHHLSRIQGSEVLAVYADKRADGHGFVLRRGYERLVAGRGVAVIEDILNTGSSAREVSCEVRRVGGTPLVVGAVVNRGGVGRKDVGNPLFFFSLLEFNMQRWSAEECPLCAQSMPINTEIGKGEAFLRRN